MRVSSLRPRHRIGVGIVGRRLAAADLQAKAPGLALA